jgi:hypothetical protein
VHATTILKSEETEEIDDGRATGAVCLTICDRIVGGWHR